MMAPSAEVLQHHLVRDLYDSPHLPSKLIHEMLAEVKSDIPPELVVKTFNEYHLYQENKKNPEIRILSEYEKPFENRKLTLLHYLILNRQIETIRFFLENFPGIDLEIRAPELDLSRNHHVLGVTSLWLATLFRDLSMMSLLLEYGANPNTTNNNGASPLRISAIDSNIEIVKILLKYKADPNQVNNFNNTTLMLASYEGETKTVDLLLESGADPNRTAYCGNTALHFAAEAGNKTIVAKLLEKGARFEKNISGMTPLFTAAFYHHEDIVDLFVSMPNLVQLEDRIRAYELLGAGISLNKQFDFSQRRADVFSYLQKAFKLRYADQDLDPQKIPRYPKEKLTDRPEYGAVKETQTLAELESIEENMVRLLYESLFALVRFFGEKNLKTAEALTMIGARLIDHFRESLQGFQMWKRAIEIKISLKVFISEDLSRFVHGLYFYNDQQEAFSFWMDIIDYSIKYFEARPLPLGLQALAFQLNVYDLSQIEHFTLNDVKVEGIISPLTHCHGLNEEKDIDQVLENVMKVVMVFAQNYNLFDEKKKNSMRNVIERFLKLNFTYSKWGRSLIHKIFVDQRIDNLNLDISPVLKLLYECGVNTNVFDDAYCTPLHYLAFFCRKNGKSIRILAALYRDLVSHIYYGQYIRNPLYHFDYGDCNTVHEDAVNIFNQTAFDIHPSLAICGDHPNIHLFPLKCLAARICHSKFIRCNQCRYLSIYRYNDRMQYNLTIRKQIKKDDDENFYDMMINIKDHYDNLKDLMNYSTKNLYGEHLPKKYEAKKVWNIINRYSEKMGISSKLLEFIEMHGPCKFVHLLDQHQE